ncbi:RING-H2 finger protein ATL60-like [Typha angustifolia]|uniref:RING-H2 finger protein ATL60-like n=1 Tax=Typha angustifolia TaxID=59011 RepID=UPI003C2C57E1
MMSIAMTTAVMVFGVISLFMIFIFVFFLYLRAKHYNGAIPTFGRAVDSLVVSADDHGDAIRRGLEPKAIKALPSMVVGAEELKDSLECPVCLSEISEGEEARILPLCSHGFHLECIDMWLRSHSTCPLCRTPVIGEPGSESPQVEPLEAVSGGGQSSGSPNLAASLLFCRSPSQDQVRTGGAAAVAVEAASSSHAECSTNSPVPSSVKPGGIVVVEIPRRVAADGLLSVPSPLALALNRQPMEETRSPRSARLWLLRKILSRGNLGIGSPSIPTEGDIEQGLGAAEDNLPLPS